MMTSIPPAEPTFDNLLAVRAAHLAPMRTGDFTAAPGEPSDMDREIVVRAGAQRAPGGSFARYLGDTLAEDLRAAGRLDPNSQLVVSGVITATHVDSLGTRGHAGVSARFTLTRAGAVVFAKTFDAHSEWTSDFVGAVAIPDAVNHYTALFPTLVGDLLADPEFIAAAR
jgi:hypothetical protein